MSRPTSQLMIAAQQHGVSLYRFFRAFGLQDLHPARGITRLGYYAEDAAGSMTYLGVNLCDALDAVRAMAPQSKEAVH